MWNGSILQRGASAAHRSRRNGFTLLELLITVAVVAILAAIALPSYSQYVIRANRAQAKQFLQDFVSKALTMHTVKGAILDRDGYLTRGAPKPPFTRSPSVTRKCFPGGTTCSTGASPVGLPVSSVGRT